MIFLEERPPSDISNLLVKVIGYNYEDIWIIDNSEKDINDLWNDACEFPFMKYLWAEYKK